MQSKVEDMFVFLWQWK